MFELACSLSSAELRGKRERSVDQGRQRREGRKKSGKKKRRKEKKKEDEGLDS